MINPHLKYEFQSAVEGLIYACCIIARQKYNTIISVGILVRIVIEPLNQSSLLNCVLLNIALPLYKVCVDKMCYPYCSVIRVLLLVLLTPLVSKHIQQHRRRQHLLTECI